MTISAKIIADSISKSGDRITTFELEYPRFIHSEFMTHRLFSRNAASSRAIPVKRAIELIKEDTARPIHWGKNMPGMSAKEECNELVLGPNLDNTFEHHGREDAWNRARDFAIERAEAFDRAGYHKQIVNRILEPFTHIKVVCTATEYDNFFWLRRHPAAQPEIQELGNRMYEARDVSTPVRLPPGEWHVPYFEHGHWVCNRLNHQGRRVNLAGVTLEDALAVSASCCAQVSYRRLDDSIEKARIIFQKLVTDKPVHASPFEHQATPMAEDACMGDTKGVTHESTVNGYHLWSGNLKWWIQHRQLIDDNVCWKYTP